MLVIHTIELQLQIDFLMYKQLSNEIPKMRQIHYGKAVSTCYTDKGIRQIELKRVDKGSLRYYIILRLNMNIIMGNNAVFVLDLKYYTEEQIIFNLQQRLHEIPSFCNVDLDTIDICKWKVIRADLAKDVCVRNPELYTLLTNLGVPYGNRRLKRTAINKPPDILFYESCYFKSKSKHINIYNKMAAQINKGQVSYKVIPDIKYLFRIEIQILKSGIKYNSSKQKDERSIRSYLNDEIVTNYLLSELKCLFGPEKYVTYSLAVQLINQSDETDMEKRKMIHTIELIHQMNGLYNLEKALTDNNSDLAKELGNLKTFKEKRLAKIRNLGINPVVIPDEYGYEELPGLCELIMNRKERD